MIRDARVLRAGFVPREVEHRDGEVNHLSSVLEPITNGDARLAIGILRTAAGTADRENHERITDDILLDAAEDARAQIKQKSIDSITPHQRVVYEVIKELVGRVLLTERMHPRDLLLQERLCSTMSAKGQLRRFENRAQLLRHISEETGADIDTLWDEYEAQVE